MPGNQLDCHLRLDPLTQIRQLQAQQPEQVVQGGTTLGIASGHTICLDGNAAGWGWFVDPAPGDNSDFTTSGNQGEQQRMDLLTVLAHEMGRCSATSKCYAPCLLGPMQALLLAVLGHERQPLPGDPHPEELMKAATAWCGFPRETACMSTLPLGRSTISNKGSTAPWLPSS
jgi:hypothetical protein